LAAPYELRRQMPTARRDAGIGEACDRVFEAGQQLIVRRLELGALEARMLARSGIALGLAALVGITGWLYVLSGLVDALARSQPRFAVELGVGAFHVALAFGLVAVSRNAAPSRSDRP
jgi:hypothetical protein